MKKKISQILKYKYHIWCGERVWCNLFCCIKSHWINQLVYNASSNCWVSLPFPPLNHSISGNLQLKNAEFSSLCNDWYQLQSSYKYYFNFLLCVSMLFIIKKNTRAKMTSLLNDYMMRNWERVRATWQLLTTTHNQKYVSIISKKKKYVSINLCISHHSCVIFKFLKLSGSSGSSGYLIVF